MRFVIRRSPETWLLSTIIAKWIKYVEQLRSELKETIASAPKTIEIQVHITSRLELVDSRQNKIEAQGVEDILNRVYSDRDAYYRTGGRGDFYPPNWNAAVAYVKRRSLMPTEKTSRTACK